MPFSKNHHIHFLYSCTIFILLLSNFYKITAQDIYPCVWRNPERTMTKLFPDAVDYKTVNIKIEKDNLKKIEKELGFNLLPGQREYFQIFEMIGTKGRKIGYIIASTQKGEYGAIEFVFGLDTNLNIKGIYIQRAREKDQSFKERYFLDFFIGKDKKSIWRYYKSSEFLSLSIPKKAVVAGIIKELVSFYYLYK